MVLLPFAGGRDAATAHASLGMNCDRRNTPTRLIYSAREMGCVPLRNSITVRKAGDEHEQAPGFIEAEMVMHCGPTLTGEFARTLTATDVFTGWTENVAVRNGAHKRVLQAMDEVLVRLAFPVIGLDNDNGGEFINHALIRWDGERDLYFTRSRPY